VGAAAYALYLVGLSSHFQKGEEMSMSNESELPQSIWDDLTESVAYIRYQFAVNKIRLVKDQGITRALDEAASLGRGQPEGSFDVAKPLLKSVEEVHVVLAFARDLRICVQHGLPVGPHLRRMTSGSTDFGVPATPNERSFFFKDFETELFVAATLVQAALPVRFLENDSDPRGEMEVEGLLIEVKHPDSPSSTLRHLTKFSNKLRRFKELGFFIRSIEDAFGLAWGRGLIASAVNGECEEQKLDEMERNGLDAARHASRLGNILGLASHPEVVGNASRFTRKGSSVVFDEVAERRGRVDLVKRIASALGNTPAKWSDIDARIVSDRQKIP
jgi:hypothetical protein